MSGKRIAVDALSRALCPSIDATLLSRALLLPLTSAGRVRVGCKQRDPGSARRCCAGQVRTAHSNSSARPASARQQLYPQWTPLPADAAPEPAIQLTRPQGQTDPVATPEPWQPDPGFTLRAPNDSATVDSDISASGSAAAVTICRSTAEFPPETRSAPTSVIYEALRILRRQRNQGPKLRNLVKYLVEERGERPNVFLYEALVVANWDTTTGSAGELAAIFKEIKSARLEPSQGWYHSALRLLAIHPDYVMRNTILNTMKQQQIELKDEGKWSVALGLLRDDQNEMALEYWDQMRKERTEIPGWVADIFIYVLTMRGFVDEAVQLFRQRLDMAGGKPAAVSLVTWSYLLDECSRSLHYEGTKFIWDEMVRPEMLTPSDGVALGVLNTAARHGDTALATAVIELLSARQVKLGLHHYEPLLESYVQTGDLENAFRVLGIMNDIGIQPDQSSTRPIFQLLKRSPELTDQAVGILSNVENLPVAAINVVLEAVVKTGDMSKTLDVYRRICDVCQPGPNQQTFVLLLEECNNAEPAVFLVSEMDRFSVRPSQPILDNLIRCFAFDGNLDVALLYLDEISSFSTDFRAWVSKRTLLTVLHRCSKEKDPRMQKLLADAKKRGMEVSRTELIPGVEQLRVI